MDPTATSTPAGFVHDDPHVADRRPNIDDIAVFHSKAHVVAGLSESVVQGLDELLVQYDARPLTGVSNLDRDSSGVEGYVHQNQVKAFIEHLISDEESLEFIVDSVLTKGYGPFTPELREKINELLRDSSQWKLYEGKVVMDSHQKRLDGKEWREAFGFPEKDDFHVDGSRQGALRVVFSHAKQTLIKQGWLERQTGGKSTPAPGATQPHIVEPEPSSVVLFDSYDGYHSQPQMTKTEFDAIGGTRQVLSLTFDFDTLIQQAKRTLVVDAGRSL
jgi:hypothetical protein